MQRLIHAMAALGAALVFGCGQSPDQPLDSTQMSDDELAAIELGPRDIEPDDPERLREALQGAEGADIGTAEQALATTTLMGHALMSVSGTISGVPGTHCIPQNSSVGTNQWLFSTGHCGNNTGFDPTPGNCTDFRACAIPASNGSGVQHVFTWRVDTSGTCAGFASADVTRLRNSAAQAANILVSGTGWTQNEAPNLAVAQVVIRCHTPQDDQPFFDSAGKATGAAAAHAVNDSFTRLGALLPAFSGDEFCPNDGAALFRSELDQYYTYRKSKVVIDLGIVNTDLAKCGASSEGQRQNFVAQILAHEFGHFIGFHHTYVNSAPSNVMWPTDTCNSMNSPALQFPAAMQRAIARLDTVSNPSTLNLATADGIACLQPYDVAQDFAYLESSPTSDRVTVGGSAPFTDNNTYGIQTGPSHFNCNWSSAGQECALPPGKTLHWCFEPAEGAQFRNDVLSHEGAVTADHWLLTNGVTGHYPSSSGGIGWIYHASCNDALVKVVISSRSCAGTGSSISQYACVVLPPRTNANLIEAIDFSPNGTAPGTYYSWGMNGGFAELHIDTADINTTIPSASRNEVFTHALRIASGWLAGIGSRPSDPGHNTDVNLNLIGSTQGTKAGDRCRVNGYKEVNKQQHIILDTYCGAD